MTGPLSGVAGRLSGVAADHPGALRAARHALVIACLLIDAWLLARILGAGGFTPDSYAYWAVARAGPHPAAAPGRGGGGHHRVGSPHRSPMDAAHRAAARAAVIWLAGLSILVGILPLRGAAGRRFAVQARPVSKPWYRG